LFRISSINLCGTLRLMTTRLHVDPPLMEDHQLQEAEVDLVEADRPPAEVALVEEVRHEEEEAQ